MSHTPYCPNELSPWARIRFSDKNLEVDASAQPGSESIGKGKPTSSKTGSARSWKRRLTNSGPTVAQDRDTSFGSSQRYKDHEATPYKKSLDRSASGAEVERVLQLRRRKMKEAHRNSNHAEVHRLQNLSLFDDIDAASHKDDRSQKTTLPYHTTEAVPSRTLVTQGHTAELCWYMKTQETSGVVIPSDFSNCAVHPSVTEPITPSSLHSANHDPSSLSSLRSSTHRASTSSSASSTQSSTWLDSDTSSVHPKPFSKLTYHPSNRFLPTSAREEEDPWLYIGRYIHTHHRFQASSINILSSTGSRSERKPSTSCACDSHTCHTYLSGPASAHCKTCRLPTPQPEIRAAIARIEAYRTAPSSAFRGDGPSEHDRTYEIYTALDKHDRMDHEDIQATSAVATAKDLQEDLLLVGMYTSAMEAQCSNGVWWEGWRVVQELEVRGIWGARAG